MGVGVWFWLQAPPLPDSKPPLGEKAGDRPDLANESSPSGSPPPPPNEPPHPLPADSRGFPSAESQESSISENAPLMPSAPPAGATARTPFADWPRLAMEPSLAEIASDWEANPAQWSPVVMPLPDGEEVTVTVEQVELLGPSGGSFVGRVENEPESSVKLSFRGGAEAGVIRRPALDQLVRIVPDGDGAVRMQVSSLAAEETTRSPGTLFPAPEMPPSPRRLPPPMDPGSGPGLPRGSGESARGGAGLSSGEGDSPSPQGFPGEFPDFPPPPPPPSLPPPSMGSSETPANP